MSDSPFGIAPARDISVRKSRTLWTVGCADCWAFGAADTWPAAMAMANAHAADEHGVSS